MARHDPMAYHDQDARPRRPSPAPDSLLTAGAPLRLAMAMGLAVGVWLAVAWALV